MANRTFVSRILGWLEDIRREKQPRVLLASEATTLIVCFDYHVHGQHGCCTISKC